VLGIVEQFLGAIDVHLDRPLFRILALQEGAAIAARWTMAAPFQCSGASAASRTSPADELEATVSPRQGKDGTLPCEASNARTRNPRARALDHDRADVPRQ
jgi:hypothetical protein